MKFRMKHHLVLVYSYTNFEFNNSKLAQVSQFRENFQKIQNLKNIERFNPFWPNSISKDRCIIFIGNFRTIAQLLRKLETLRKLQALFKIFEIP